MRSLASVAFLYAALASAPPALACALVEEFVAGESSELTEGAACSNPSEHQCRWSFDYRAEAAETVFETIQAQLRACLGAPVTVDAPVNHPDSYRLEQFESDGVVISLSLKDKASHKKTFVFLRVDKSGR